MPSISPDRVLLPFAAAFGLLFVAIAKSEVLIPDDFSQPATTNWPMVGGGWDNARYSTLTEINTQTVKQLGAIWVSDQFDDGGASHVTPVVKDGVMFLTGDRSVYALNAKTGERIWSYKTVEDRPPSNITSGTDRSSAPKLPNAAPNARGVAIGQGLIFVGLYDGHVIALHQETGELAWMQQTGVDEPKKLQMASPAPTYIDGIVLTGLSSGDGNLRGRITAIEAGTGKRLWQMFTVPGPGEAGHETWPSFNDTWKVGGGGVWTNAAVDSELGIAYFSTGNPVPGFAGDWRPGDNLYTCSVVAVDIKTGKLKWYYQLVRHDVFEADAGTPVILYDARVDGRIYKALAVLRADGHLFQLDRKTGKPLLPVAERPVPQLESQKTSPTQPFPIEGESILMSCEEWKKENIPAGFVLGCMWTPPAFPPPAKDPQNVLAPFPSARVSPMAYSVETGYFYAQATSFLSWPRRSQDPYNLTFDTTVLNLKAYAELAAIDSRTGKIAWTRSIHTAGRLPIYLRGGLLATAGGLVFRSSGDGNIEAYDAKNGNIRWRFQTGIVDGRGSPVSYEVGGEQYVAVPMGPAVWAFKLGGKIAAAEPAKVQSEDDIFVGPIENKNVIETTSIRYSSYATGVRYFIDELTFNPYRARVTPGRKVMFVNNGSMHHEIVALDGSWGTGPLSPAQDAWVIFDKLGRHTYICKEHPWTYGQIIVTADSPSQSQETGNADVIKAEAIGFTERALRGQQQFKESCSECHGEDLSGRSPAPALVGRAFALRWEKAAAVDLFDNIRTTMPQTSPGSLDTETYENIVAYLLLVNNLSSKGSELQHGLHISKKDPKLGVN